jgi:hypothetical protein
MISRTSDKSSRCSSCSWIQRQVSLVGAIVKLSYNDAFFFKRIINIRNPIRFYTTLPKQQQLNYIQLIIPSAFCQNAHNISFILHNNKNARLAQLAPQYPRRKWHGFERRQVTFSIFFCILYYTKFVLYILINFYIKYKTLWSSD